MAKYRLYKNNNERSRGYGKYYARKAAGQLMNLDDLVAHMAGHNTAYSKGVIKGVITDMVECVREMAYEGNQVKIENLGIFQVSMKSKGVADPKDFSAATDIQSKWQVRPTGECRMKTIGITRAGGALLSWEEASDYASPRSTTTPSSGD